MIMIQNTQVKNIENQFLNQMKTPIIVLMMTRNQLINNKSNRYILDKNSTDNPHARSTHTDTCHLDLQKLRQLQKQEENITKLISKCKSSEIMKPLTI